MPLGNKANIDRRQLQDFSVALSAVIITQYDVNREGNRALAT